MILGHICDLFAQRFAPGEKSPARERPQYGNAPILNGTKKIPLYPSKMTRAANQPDDLIDPVRMNAHRAVPRTVSRGVCEIGLDPGRSSHFALVVQPMKICQLGYSPGLNEAVADQLIDIEL